MEPARAYLIDGRYSRMGSRRRRSSRRSNDTGVTLPPPSESRNTAVVFRLPE